MKSTRLCRFVYGAAENSLEHYAAMSSAVHTHTFAIFMIYPSCATAHPYSSVCAMMSLRTFFFFLFSPGGASVNLPAHPIWVSQTRWQALPSRSRDGPLVIVCWRRLAHTCTSTILTLCIQNQKIHKGNIEHLSLDAGDRYWRWMKHSVFSWSFLIQKVVERAQPHQIHSSNPWIKKNIFY